MLLGRRAECDRLDALLEGTREGRSGALVIRGEPGIGKSALLLYAKERSDDILCLEARGVESESDIPFSSLLELIRPILSDLGSIPGPQSAAVGGALALSAPAPGDRFTIYAGTISLLAAAAENRPIVALVDDAQWVDVASAESLLFTARRLHAEPIGLIFAVRSDEDTLFDADDLPAIELSGLDYDMSLQLLMGRLPDMSVEVAQRLISVTKGNPLALQEVPSLLSDEQLAGSELLEEPLHVGPILQEAFSRRIAGLEHETRNALLVAAADEAADIDVMSKAAGSLGVTFEAFEAAEQARLVNMRATGLEFAHPLIRSAVYYGATPAERRAVHRALAETLGERGADRRAWHLAAAALGPNEEVAASLEGAALNARARGGYGVAANTFEQAAHLTPQDDRCAKRLLEAARDSQLAGSPPRAMALLDQALARATDNDLIVEIQHLRGLIAMWIAGAEDAHDLLVRTAAQIEEVDADRAAGMLCDATLAAATKGGVLKALATAQRASEVAARASDPVKELADVCLGEILCLRGEAATGLPLMMKVQSLLGRGDPLMAASPAIQYSGLVFTWVEEYATARALIEQFVEMARAMSAPSFLPYALAGLSDLDFRTGQWSSAQAAASEAIRLAEETGQELMLGAPLICAARVEAGMGQEESCREHATRAAQLARKFDLKSIRSYADAALGLLELGRGSPKDAIPHLRATARNLEESGVREPAVVQFAPDLVEAQIRVGDEEGARRDLSELEWQAQHTGRIWALAAAARCRGLLADEGTFENEFVQALQWHARTPTPFEHARTQLCLGGKLRRHKARRRAREHLRAALEIFEELGARPWADQARTELRASGEMPHGGSVSITRKLTPQELQVAFVVARGTTNKEAASALFVSPKTIDFHLGNVYRKLNLRSRAELVRLFAVSGAASEVVRR